MHIHVQCLGLYSFLRYEMLLIRQVRIWYIGGYLNVFPTNFIIY